MRPISLTPTIVKHASPVSGHRHLHVQGAGLSASSFPASPLFDPLPHLRDVLQKRLDRREFVQVLELLLHLIKAAVELLRAEARMVDPVGSAATPPGPSGTPKSTGGAPITG